MTYISKITSSNLTYVFLKYFQNHVVIFAIKTLMPDFSIQTIILGPVLTDDIVIIVVVYENHLGKLIANVFFLPFSNTKSPCPKNSLNLT